MKKPLSSEFARIVTSRLAELGWKKTDLLNKLEEVGAPVSFSYISKITNDGQIPAAEMTEKIAEALNMDRDALFRELVRYRTDNIAKEYFDEPPARVMMKIYGSKGSQQAADLAEHQSYPVVGTIPSSKPITLLQGDYVNEKRNYKESATAPGEHCYAVRVGNTDMLPVIPPRTVLVADPHLQVRDGDMAIVQLKDGRVEFGMVEEHSEESVFHLKKLSPSAKIITSRARGSVFVHRVVALVYPED